MGAVVNQAPAGVDYALKQLLLKFAGVFPAAHDGHKTIEGIEIAEINITFTHGLQVGHDGQMQM